MVQERFTRVEEMKKTLRDYEGANGEAERDSCLTHHLAGESMDELNVGEGEPMQLGRKLFGKVNKESTGA